MAAALVAASASADYTTPGEGVTYTLTELSGIEGSGVTMETETSFLLSSDLTIAEKDNLSLGAGEMLLMQDGVTLTVNGEALFNPEETAYIMPNVDTALPKAVIFNGKTTLKNLKWSGAGMRYAGSDALIVDKCDFYDINGENSLYGVIVIAGHSSGSVISNCTFTDCQPGAINTPANMGVGLIIENNVITNVSMANGMRPFINVTSNATEPVIIRHNVLNGAKLSAPGGIGVSNMLNTPGDNKVYVEYNTVTDCSWGLNFVGGMDVRIIGNTVKDNCWDPDVNGGIGATLYSIASYPQTVYAQENVFEGNKWGPCTVGATVANFGKTEDPTAEDYNPGLNVFRNNKHLDASGEEVRVDFCNNTQITQYAQGNFWNDATTAEEVAATIQDNKFSASYGPVIYTPFGDPSGVTKVTMDKDVAFNGSSIVASETSVINVYDLSGRLVSTAVGTLSTSDLQKGVYIARVGSKSLKFVK